jgi:hypothetical protein
MSAQVELRCRCGEVRALVTGASRRTVNRVVCYCDDCQAFAHQLGRADLLDSQGGSDIVQVAPASLRFVQGQHRIVGLQLKPKGLFRWYANCCNTPVGNTHSARQFRSWESLHKRSRTARSAQMICSARRSAPLWESTRLDRRRRGQQG